MTAANAVEEAARNGKSLNIPYWRTLKADGSLNEKISRWCRSPEEIIRNGSFTVISKGKKYFVKDYLEHQPNYNYQFLFPLMNSSNPFFFMILRFFTCASSCTPLRKSSFSHDSYSLHCQHPTNSFLLQQLLILQNGGPPPFLQPFMQRNLAIKPKVS